MTCVVMEMIETTDENDDDDNHDCNHEYERIRNVAERWI